MATESTNVKTSAWTVFVKKSKKILKWGLALIVIIGAVFIYWKYFYTYSEGYRAGVLQKFSRKGMIFKTYEGEMILSSVSSTQEVVLASEKFLFTMTNKDLVRQFDALQGNMVVVHYKQKNSRLPWQGDTPYLVDSVKLKQ
jgi:hypothetical protein